MSDYQMQPVDRMSVDELIRNLIYMLDNSLLTEDEIILLESVKEYLIESVAP